MTLATIQDQITILEEKEQRLMQEDKIDTEELAKVKERLNNLREQTEEQQQREQKKLGTIEAHVDVVSEIFAALFPRDSYIKIFGPDEYDIKQQQFYQLTHAYNEETVNAIYTEHDQILAEKDEKIKLLTLQGLETEDQLAQQKEIVKQQGLSIQKLTDETNAVVTELRNVKIALEQKTDENASLSEEVERLKNREYELQKQIASAPAPTVRKAIDAEPSQTLKEKIAAIKQLSADEMIARFNARQNEENKIPVAELPVINTVNGGDSFRAETPKTQPADGGVLVAQAVTVESFRPTGESTDGDSETQATVSGAEVSADRTVVGQTLEERVALLERRVEQIERHANLPGVA